MLLQWELFKLPDLDCFDVMLKRLLKQECENIVMDYEAYRMALCRELERRLYAQNALVSPSIVYRHILAGPTQSALTPGQHNNAGAVATRSPTSKTLPSQDRALVVRNTSVKASPSITQQPHPMSQPVSTEQQTLATTNSQHITRLPQDLSTKVLV